MLAQECADVCSWLKADSFGPRVGGPLYPQYQTSEAQERLGLKKRLQVVADDLRSLAKEGLSLL